MHTLEPLIAEIELFRGMNPRHLQLVAGCAANVRFESDEFLGRAGDPADHFWVIRQGSVALEIFSPERGSITVATMGEGDIVGFSWLVPPYLLRFDVHAVTATRALLFDGRCLRGKCEVDAELGHELLKRFSQLVVQRLDAVSLQLLDVYGEHPENAR
jgi:CRP-like cAMP-binding protein